MSIHTGLTPTEETFHIHTGLTPTDDSFSSDPTESNPSADSLTFDTTANLDFTFTNPFSSLSDDPLTIQADTTIRQRAERNSIDELLDTALVGMPSFTAEDELTSFGNIVGPSQGVVPGPPFSLDEPEPTGTDFDSILRAEADQMMKTANFEAGFVAPQFAFPYGNAFGHPLSAMPMSAHPMSAYPMSAFPYGNMVSDPFFGASTHGIPAPVFGSTFDTNPFTAYNNMAVPQLQQPQFPAGRKESSSTDASCRSPPAGIDAKLAPTVHDKFVAELPSKPVDKPWVRVNSSTKGKSSRTGKINHYDPTQFYSQIPHPLDSKWTGSSGRSFTYNKWHELTKDYLTASQMREFIHQHPKNKSCKLTLFIQRAPADSKRRYPTSSLDKCRFKDCPMRLHGNKGSMLHGHYRVALDELSYKYGKGEHNDPFLVAGYVHLYCLERFLDLPEICRLKHVRIEADGRQIAKEPNGNFAPALGGSECRVVTSFIEAARKTPSGRIQDHAEWRNYPESFVYSAVHGASRTTLFNVHRATLNYKLQMCKMAGRGGKVMNKLKPSNVAVHRGDLEMYCLGRKNLLDENEIQQIEDELMKIDPAPAPLPAMKKRRASSGASNSSAKRVRFQ